MSKIVNEFLADVKKDKVKQLLGIKLDQEYWQKVISASDGEEQLRKELEVENDKRVLNKNGTIFRDNRDLVKVEDLNKKINNITKATQELQRLNEMEAGIKGYMSHITKPSKDTLDELEKVAKL